MIKKVTCKKCNYEIEERDAIETENGFYLCESCDTKRLLKSDKEVWDEAIAENKIDKLPSIYSNENPPYMHERMMWNKINELVDIINKMNNK